MKKLIIGFCIFLTVNGFSQVPNETIPKLKYTVNVADGERIRYASFSPDGKNILLVNENSTQIWSADTGKLILTFPKPIKLINGAYLKWQPNGSKILQFGEFSKKPTAYLWETKNGKLISELEENYGVNKAEWNRKGDKILTVGGSNSSISIGKSSSAAISFSVRDENGTTIKNNLFELNALIYIGFSSDGDKLIKSFRFDNKAKSIGIFDAKTDTILKSFDISPEKKSYPVYPIFTEESADGKYFCGQIQDSKGVGCWQISGGELPIYTFLDNKESGNNTFLSFSRNSKYLTVSQERKKAIVVVDAQSGDIIKTLDNPNMTSLSLDRKGISKLSDLRRNDSWSPSGKFFVASNFQKEANIWNIETGKLIAKLPVVYDEEEDLFVGTQVTNYEVFAFNSNEDFLLSVSLYAVKLWKTKTGELLWEMKDVQKKDSQATYQSFVAGWNLSGNLLMTAGDKNKSVLLWEFSALK